MLKKTYNHNKNYVQRYKIEEKNLPKIVSFFEVLIEFSLHFWIAKSLKTRSPHI